VIATKPRITWFTNNHEHSTHYIKFGLMQMAEAGEIVLREVPVVAAGALLPSELVHHPYRRLVVLLVENGSRRKLVAIDGEDSPFQLSNVIEYVDLYFTCTYAPCFYESRTFEFALPWQTESELSHYRQLQFEITERYGHHFHKVRPSAPMGPNLDVWQEHPNLLRRRWHNLRHKIRSALTPWTDWRPQYQRFQKRWNQILDLRHQPILYDVVLKDSLWGWPRHRIELHRELAQLAANGAAICSELNYRQAFAYELGDHAAPDPDLFPMVSGGDIGADYEAMLAASRLGVFATGFHYGWRNIVTFAWALGLKTLQDPFLYTFLFDPAPFYQSLGAEGWQNLGQIICAARLETSAERQCRWILYDKEAAPQRLSALLLDEVSR